MNSKYIFRYAFAASLLISSVSCKKSLNLQPISDATVDNSYTSAKQAEAALAGAYNTFVTTDYYIWDNLYLGDVRADNNYAGGDNPDFYQLDYLQVSTTNSKILGDWTTLYNGILKANTVIQRVPVIADPALTAVRKAQIVGEAKFLRAYHYFQLVKLWGGVPLITVPVSGTDPDDINTPRSTVAEVYNQIITDLTDAATTLPDSYGDPGINKARATKGAANALLAKVYAQKPDRDYNKVLQYANAVINSPAGYTLLPNYSYLFDSNHYNNDESILEGQYNGTTISNWSANVMLPPSVNPTTWRKFFTPSRDLVKAFDSEGDVVRKGQTMIFEQAPWADEYWSVNINGVIPFPYKIRNITGSNSTSRQYMLRLADIILLKAEASNELNNPGDAITQLNLIRHRAGLGDTPATSQADLRLAIEKERRLELALEGHRWDDLIRYGKAETVMNSLVETNLITGQRVNYNMTTQKELLPIPQTELNRNPNLKQNPGY
jgi:hypothetical protein